MYILIFLQLLFVISLPSYGIDNFTHESEFSSVTSRGNTPYETYNTKTNNRIIVDSKHDVTFGGHYTYGTINDEQLEIARNWDVNTKYLTAITNKTYAFLGLVVEGDEYAGFSERNNIDLGFNTKYIDRDDFKLYFDYGYRQTVEIPIEGETRKDQKLRFYGKLEDKLNESTSYGLWIEYIPNLTTPEDYMISFEPSLRVAINSILSLKVSYKGMYDNMPAIEQRKYYDEIYTTSLLAKF